MIISQKCWLVKTVAFYKYRWRDMGFIVVHIIYSDIT